MAPSIEILIDTENDGIVRRFVDFEPQTSIAQHVQHAGLLDDYPHITIDNTPVGVFNKRCDWQDIVRPGDRIELYRELTVDIKQKRYMAVKKERRG